MLLACNVAERLECFTVPLHRLDQGFKVFDRELGE
jgi:hypothetical protein